MKKRKTLPNELVDLIKNGNHEEIIAVLNQCEVNATFRSSDKTVFFVEEVSYEVLEFVIENGGNIERKDTYGNTVLHTFASNINVNHFEKLLKLGANVNAVSNDGTTPLHRASQCFRIDNVKLLIENSADIYTINNNGDTPFLDALKNASNAHLDSLVKLSELYFNLGTKITDEMRNQIVKIGENFEFYRDRYNPEMIKETEDALNKLYHMYDVSQVNKLLKHDGVEPINVPDLSLCDQHSKLWEYLVPGAGHAQTVQSEVIRVTGKVSREILNNGGMNWDKNFKIMCRELCKYVAMENKLEAMYLKELKEIIDTISKNGKGNEEDIDSMYTYAIEWIKLNPTPIQLKKIRYKR